MLACDTCDITDTWTQFLEFVKKRCSSSTFGNWFTPIKVLESTPEKITLEIPNVFVKEYLLSNFKEDLRAFLPVDANGEPAIHFVIAKPTKDSSTPEAVPSHSKPKTSSLNEIKLNHNYRFDTFIEGPTNQFVKSAAMGVAKRPGQSYNPLFIHGPVGLGKTHILHSIGHYVQENNKKMRVKCITTEAFINDLVECLRNKSVNKWKRFYRSDIDVLLVDDIQFLQNRLNFEEEFCNTFETLINQNKQIVITSDKPPAQLKLSERITQRMEWGLVSQLGPPDLETRTAILQDKAQQKGLDLPHDIAFYIAEHIFCNVRQLEGAINRLCAYSRLLNMDITKELVEKSLREMLEHVPRKNISVEEILKSVATVFQVRVSELKSSSRLKEVVLARQVAMYISCKFIKGTLKTIADSFGKTHSTLLHAYKKIEKKAATDDTLQRQIEMVLRSIEIS